MSFGKTNYRVGGTRGGADQFKWDDVKNDKYRENYLGHSVQAPVGRWQKDKDLTWYAKANKAERAGALQSELALAKQRDDDLMNEALGIAPKQRRKPVEGLSESEMKELLKRGEAERDGMDVERVEGLGAAPVEAAGFETGPKRTLAERYKDQLASGRADTTYALPGTVHENMTESEMKAAKKEARRAEKTARKLKKKEKKERKKEKKEKRHHGRDYDNEEEDKPRHHYKSEAGSGRRSRSRPPLRRLERGEDSVRRSRSASRQRRSERSRSRSPADRRRYELSARKKTQPRQESRGRSRSSGSPSSRYRRHRRRSTSFSPRRRSRSRSRRH